MSSQPAPLKRLVAKWRDDAQVLRRRGAEAQADLLEDCADEAEAAAWAFQEEELTIAEAARESGYSEEHLRALVRAGDLSDPRPEGSQGRIRIRRGDLPRKSAGTRPKPSPSLEEEAERFAERVRRMERTGSTP